MVCSGQNDLTFKKFSTSFCPCGIDSVMDKKNHILYNDHVLKCKFYFQKVSEMYF